LHNKHKTIRNKPSTRAAGYWFSSILTAILYLEDYIMRLVISEKPSVAASIAAVLGADTRKDGYFEGNGYIVSYCYGHLLELAAPDCYDEKLAKWRYEDLPIIPSTWKHVPAKDKAQQLKILNELLNRSDLEYVVNSCDAGREGEHIFRLVYEYSMSTADIKRLWISSLEDAAIRDGFAKLKDGKDYDSLFAAASCRERADWCCGISATRLFSVLYGTTLNVGRVQSPTLAMLVKREDEIESFVKEPFYIPTLDLSVFMAGGERQTNRSTADKIADACLGQRVTVTDVDRVTKTVAPPKLYDLTGLQRDANKAFGFTAMQTLDIVQSLYERKALSYPRTDAKYITADMSDTVRQIIGETDFEPDIDRIIGKVSDHHAIIPTLESKNTNNSSLPSGERELYELVRKRLIAAVSPKHVYEAVTVTLDCGGNVFTAKGKTVIEQGWKAAQSGSDTDDDNDYDVDHDDVRDDGELPELSKGQTFDSSGVTVKEGFTKPKPHYTEATILSAMENAGAEDFREIEGEVERKGLGTSATRATILEALVKRGYVERVKKNLLATQKGKNLIAVLPNALTSAKLTAEWEDKLLQVQRGELDADEFMTGIAAFIKAIVLSENKAKPECAALFPNEKKQDTLSLGSCPRCGAPVRESGKGFFCDNRACGFKLWKDSKFWTSKKKPLTAAVVTALLNDGRVKLTGLLSEKTGKKYDATVILDDDGGQFVNYKVEFAKR
jgi:DNA topoisomerase-3